MEVARLLCGACAKSKFAQLSTENVCDEMDCTDHSQGVNQQLIYKLALPDDGRQTRAHASPRVRFVYHWLIKSSDTAQVNHHIKQQSDSYPIWNTGLVIRRSLLLFRALSFATVNGNCPDVRT